MLAASLGASAADISGRVTAANAPVEGVLVSDGYTFATTDAQGAYTLATNPRATTVFMIVPSGYEVDPAKSANGRGGFYHLITDAAAVKTDADFALRSIGNDTNFHFMVQADSQPNLDLASGAWDGMYTAFPDIQKTADELRTADGFAPFMLHLGDITYRPTDHDLYSEFLGKVKFSTQLFTVTGNHDKNYNGTDYNECVASYNSHFGPTWYSLNRGKIHFLMLDDTYVYGPGNRPDADTNYTFGFEQDMLDWVKADLARVEEGSQVVLCIHQQLTASKKRVGLAQPLLDLLTHHNVLILSGHLHKHNNYASVAPNIRERNQTSLSGYEWRGPCAEDGSPKGYYIYAVNGENISWKFKQTGKDPDKFMFKIYEPGNLDVPEVRAEEDKQITVNVWDWDSHWTLSYSVDGKDMGAPVMFKGQDPLALYNYAGRKAGYEVPETYHLFRCDVPRTGGEMTFTATDPFGRTLSKTITLPHVADGIEGVSADGAAAVVAREWFTPQGVAVATAAPAPGLYIVRETIADGTVRSTKTIVR